VTSTGPALQRIPEKMLDVDWDLLPRDNEDTYFLPIDSPSSLRMFFPYSDGHRERLTEYDKQFLAKNWGIFLTSKGCVNRCTFCHRFIGGLRILPMNVLFSRLSEMVRRFNLGYIQFGDECFGLNAKWIEEFCSRIEPMGLVWGVAGMRTDCVRPEILKRMKKAGCRIVNYGFETLSGKMLEVMEKGVKKQDNIQAMHWTIEAGLNSITQLVIGMPGETSETIRETAECVADFLTLGKEQNPDVSVNYAQALPGTPLYEYGRAKGLIGSSVEDEEQYLLDVFNRNAADFASKTNFTAFPKFMLSVWNYQIRCLVNKRYAARFGMDHYLKMAFPDEKPTVVGLLKKRDIGAIIRFFPNLSFRLAKVIGFLYACKGGWKNVAFTIRELWMHLFHDRWPSSRDFPYVSLRETLDQMETQAYRGSPDMVPLRKGM